MAYYGAYTSTTTNISYYCAKLYPWSGNRTCKATNMISYHIAVNAIEGGNYTWYNTTWKTSSSLFYIVKATISHEKWLLHQGGQICRQIIAAKLWLLVSDWWLRGVNNMENIFRGDKALYLTWDICPIHESSFMLTCQLIPTNDHSHLTFPFFHCSCSWQRLASGALLVHTLFTIVISSITQFKAFFLCINYPTSTKNIYTSTHSLVKPFYIYSWICSELRILFVFW